MSSKLAHREQMSSMGSGALVLVVSVSVCVSTRRKSDQEERILMMKETILQHQYSRAICPKCPWDVSLRISF